jgi:hypothetical protein
LIISINGDAVATIACDGGAALWPGHDGAPALPWTLSVTRRLDDAVQFSGQLRNLPEWFAQIGDVLLGPSPNAILGPAGPSCPPGQ